MTVRVILAPAASRDVVRVLTDIYENTGARVFARYRDDFDCMFFERLATFPESYQARPQLGRHVRAAVLWPYLIFYRYVPASDLVEIIRVAHGRQRVTQRFLAD